MFIPSSSNYSFKNCTLIFPSVSVGNVGQLSADLLISTLSMEQVGYIVHQSLLPCIGSNPFAANGQNRSHHITTSCEVYQSKDLQIVVLQQRAPFVKGKRKEFSDWLTSWIHECLFEQVVILTSTFAHERIDQQLSGPPFRILLTPKMNEKCGNHLKNQLGWKELEKRHSFPTPSAIELREHSGDSQLLYMPGSGIAKQLFDNCQNLPILVLLMFVSEGDNAVDAIALTDQLNQWLKLHCPMTQEQPKNDNKMSWIIPPSWQLAFGSRFDPILYQ